MKTTSAAGDPGGVLGGELQVVAGGGQQVLQVGLVDRGISGTQARNFDGVGIDAGHTVSQVGETGSGGEAYVAGSDDADVHKIVIPSSVSGVLAWTRGLPADRRP